MKTNLFFLSLSVLLASCATINLSQPGADDLYWVKSDGDPMPVVEPMQTTDTYQEDYWESGGGTTATTQSGDVIVNNYNGGYAPSNNAYNWMGWDPYWGWGFGLGWHHPQYYAGWYNFGFCYGNNWYNPYWYHNPWAYGGWGAPGYCSPYAYPFGYYGYSGPVIWGNGNWSDGGGSNGYFYGPFTSVSTNSGSNSSYNGQGQHLGRISPVTEPDISDGIGKKPVTRPNYVERVVIPSTDSETPQSSASATGRELMNVPKPQPKPVPSMAKPQKPMEQNKPSWGSIDLPPLKAPETKPAPSKQPAPSPSPSASPSRNSGSSSPAPSGGGGSGRSGGNSGGGSGGGGSGGGRPPRN